MLGLGEGDILILHTGWHKHYEGQPQQDLVRYFCYHPGPNLDTLHWMFKKKIKWWGMDTGSCDHAMNTSIRYMRPDLAEEFTKKHGKPPENHAWIEYVSLKMMAQAMNETKSTDTEQLIAYFEKETQFDILKARKAYFRAWDHQLIQEAYPFTVKAKGKAKDKWDFLDLGAAIPGPNERLEVINPTKEQNACSM